MTWENGTQKSRSDIPAQVTLKTTFLTWKVKLYDFQYNASKLH